MVGKCRHKKTKLLEGLLKRLSFDLNFEVRWLPIDDDDAGHYFTDLVSSLLVSSA